MLTIQLVVSYRVVDEWTADKREEDWTASREAWICSLIFAFDLLCGPGGTLSLPED